MLFIQTALARDRVRTLLLALAAALVAVATMTLVADAQTLDDGSEQADPLQGRIIARIQDRGGGVDDYRIEFGFFPEWALRQADFADRVSGAWSGWLPRIRFVAKSEIDRRAANDDRRWLRSSLITVPAQPPGGDGTEITGRVIARYNPNQQGRLRVEFGFLPESAFTSTANTEQAVAQFGEQFLPRSRYLSDSLITNRRGTWLRSSVVNLASLSSSGGDEQTGKPVIDNIACSPPSPSAGDVATCTARLSGGRPTSWSWGGGDSIGRSATYRTAFSSAGVQTVSLSVSNSAGVDHGTTTVDVQGPVASRPQVWRINCEPPLPQQHENVTCTAEIRGGSPTSWKWHNNHSNATANTAVYRVLFDETGDHRVMLTVSNETGWDDHYTILRVVSRRGTLEAVGRISGVTVDVNGSERVEVAGSFRDRTDHGLIITVKSDNDAVGVRADGDIVTVIGYREGSATITVVARNSNNDTAKQTFRVTVNPRRVETSCASIAPLTVGEGSSERVNVRCDGQNLRIRAVSDSEAVATVSVAGDQLTVLGISTGRARITVSATGGGGIDTVTFDVTVTQATEVAEVAPSIRNINCTPHSAQVGQTVTCFADLQGGAPTSWSWTDGVSRSRAATYRTVYSSSGDKRVSLTVSNGGGSDTRSVTVHVAANVARVPSSGYGRCGSDGIRVYWFNPRNSTKHWINVTGEQATSVFGLPWWDTIGHMSQSDCDSWPTGRNLTMSDLPPR